jgi:hypothetical protein
MLKIDTRFRISGNTTNCRGFNLIELEMVRYERSLASAKLNYTEIVLIRFELFRLYFR